MTWYDTFFTRAAWQEFARVHPDEARTYRQFPGQAHFLRQMITDFFMAYEGR